MGFLKNKRFQAILFFFSFLLFCSLLFLNFYFSKKSSQEKSEAPSTSQKSPDQANTKQGSETDSSTSPPSDFKIEVNGVNNYRLINNSLTLFNLEGKIKEIQDKTITIERAGETKEIEITEDFEIFSLNHLQREPIWKVTSFENLKIGDKVSVTLPDQNRGIKGKIVIFKEKI